MIDFPLLNGLIGKQQDDSFIKYMSIKALSDYNTQYCLSDIITDEFLGKYKYIQPNDDWIDYEVIGNIHEHKNLLDTKTLNY